MAHTPRECARCGVAYGKPRAGRLKCASCAFEYDIPSGDDLNRQWVLKYREEYSAASLAASPAAPVA